jgi:superfamily II DNA helicase RecQ
MARKKHFDYRLDCGEVDSISEAEIVTILRAADPIIGSGGRTLLAKILKGSKDKAVLSREFDKNPCYGAFSDKSIQLIINMIDRCIIDSFLKIDYEGKMPVLVFTDKGWSIEKEVYADELLEQMLDDTARGKTDFIDRMLSVNPVCVLLALDKLGHVEESKLLDALRKWQPLAQGKVKKRLNAILRKS